MEPMADVVVVMIRREGRGGCVARLHDYVTSYHNPYATKLPPSNHAVLHL